MWDPGFAATAIEEELKDVTFEQQFVPRSDIGNILINLYKRKAFDEESAILLSEYPIKVKFMDLLIKQKRVTLFMDKIYGSIKIYLTLIGKIIAFGELILRKRVDAK